MHLSIPVYVLHTMELAHLLDAVSAVLSRASQTTIREVDSLANLYHPLIDNT